MRQKNGLLWTLFWVTYANRTVKNRTVRNRTVENGTVGNRKCLQRWQNRLSATKVEQEVLVICNKVLAEKVAKLLWFMFQRDEKRVSRISDSTGNRTQDLCLPHCAHCWWSVLLKTVLGSFSVLFTINKATHKRPFIQ